MSNSPLSDSRPIGFTPTGTTPSIRPADDRSSIYCLTSPKRNMSTHCPTRNDPSIDQPRVPVSFAKTSSDSFKQPEVLPRIQDYEPRGEGLPGNGILRPSTGHGQTGFGVEDGKRKGRSWAVPCAFAGRPAGPDYPAPPRKPFLHPPHSTNRHHPP